MNFHLHADTRRNAFAVSWLQRCSILLFIFLALMGEARAQFDNVTAPTTSAPVSGGLRYLLASDAARGVITGATRVTYGSAGTYRLNWTVIDAADDPKFSFISASIERTSSGTELTDRTADLDPKSAAPDFVLDHRERYRVRVRLQKWNTTTFQWNTVDTATEAGARQYFHFASEDSSDGARNVLADVLGSAVYGTLDDPGTNLVEGIAEMEHFDVVIGYRLLRYDAFLSASPGTQNIQIFADFTLHEAGTNNPVPLQQGRVAVTAALPTWELDGSTKVPAIVLGTIGLPVDPTGLLDSTKQYYVKYTLSHQELGTTEKVGTTAQSADRTIVHCNGTLRFELLDTTITALASRPALTSAGPLYAEANLVLTSAFVTNFPAIVFGSGETIPVWVMPDGTAIAKNTTGISMPLPLNSTGTINGVAFERTGSLILRETGPTATLRVTLPGGFAVRTDADSAVLSGSVDFTAVPLDNNLLPSQPVVIWAPFGVPIRFFEESKPVWLMGDELHWHTASGTFTIEGSPDAAPLRKPLLTQLSDSSALLEVPGDAVKRSNDHLLNGVDGVLNAPTISRDANNDAWLRADFSVDANDFHAHFPYNAHISWTTGGDISVQDDAFVNGSFLDGAATITLPYRRSCPPELDSCPASVQRSIVEFGPASGRLWITPRGGITAAGAVTTGGQIRWGAQEPGQFAHGTDRAFTQAELLVAGSFVQAGSQATADDAMEPAAMLLQGYSRAPVRVEDVGSTAYTEGLANYAGLNFRLAGPDAAVEGRTRIGGQIFPYALKANTKLYARESGVSGIFDAVSSYAAMAVLYDYPFEIEGFGLSFLSNRNHDSRIAGSLSVPAPADIKVSFERMTLTCDGKLSQARVKAGTAEETLAYWQAPIEMRRIRFVAESACDPTSDCFLAVFGKMQASYMEQPLLGEIGIRPTGQLLRPTDGIAGLDSRISLPSVARIRGPVTELLDSIGTPFATEEETWLFTPVQKAYLNHAPSAPGVTGFWNFLGQMDVPFFISPVAHLHLPALGGETGTLYAMGGWEVGGIGPAEQESFDFTNRAFPPGVMLDAYRTYDAAGQFIEPATDVHLVRARQGLMDLAELNYPLRWHPLRHSFTSIRPVVDQQLGVVAVDHRVDYLSPGHGHLKFASQFDAFPQINLEDAFTNIANEHLGAAQTLANATGQNVVTAMRLGVEAVAGALSDSRSPMFRELLNGLVDPMLDAVMADLLDHAAGDPEYTTLDDLVDAYFQNGGALTLGAILGAYNTGLNGAEGLVTNLERRLHQLDASIDALSGTLTVDPLNLGANLPNPEPGLFGATNEVSKLIEGMLRDLGDDFDGLVTDNLQVVFNQINAAQPRLDQAKEKLRQTQDRIRMLRVELGAGGIIFNDPNLMADADNFRAELDDALLAAQVELYNTVVLPAAAQLKQLLNALPFADEAAIERIGPLLRSTVKAEVAKRFLASGVVEQYREQLQRKINSTYADYQRHADSLFSTVNEIVRNIAEGTLRNVDRQLDSFLGDLSETVKGGKIDGHVFINDDSITDLRLDLELDLNVTERLKTRGFLHYSRWDAQGAGVCRRDTNGDPAIVDAALAPEITFGVENAPVPGFGRDVIIDAGGQFSFSASENKVIALSGWLHQKAGVIPNNDAVLLWITNLNAEMVFGRDENYLSGAADARWSAFRGLDFTSTYMEQGARLQGGFFEGVACNANPILAWDPSPTLQVGQANFSGSYVHAAGELPLLRIFCVIDIGALVDFGIFHSKALGIEDLPIFGDVPRVGGQLGLGVSGEALCLVEVWGKGTLALETTTNVALALLGTFPDPSFAGTVEVGGRAGVCPWCVEYSERLGLRVGRENGVEINFLGRWYSVTP